MLFIIVLIHAIAEGWSGWTRHVRNPGVWSWQSTAPCLRDERLTAAFARKARQGSAERRPCGFDLV